MFKDRLRQARQARGLTHDQLAAQMAPPVTRGTVCHWEAGRTQPKRDNMIRLAQVLATSVEWLSGSAPIPADPGGLALRRDLLERVEIALESYLQGNGLTMAPADRWEAVLSLYQWGEDAERASGAPAEIKIESVRAFLRGLRQIPPRP